MNEPSICSICQLPLSTGNCCNSYTIQYGNNAQPVNDGKCCDDCNDHVVIPARINAINQSEAKSN